MSTDSLRILVVDDQEDIRRALETLLTRAGHTVFTARNGKEAIAKLTPDLDLIISDVMMPEMDGFEMLMQLRAESPDTKVIVMSGGGVQDKHEVLAITRQMGAAAVLSKPFTAEELQQAMAQVLAEDD